MAMIPETNVDSKTLKKGFAFHKNLNPKIWDGDEMRLEVRVALLRAAKAFFDFIALDDMGVHDVIFTGSNAAFNYTEMSDLDVHIIVDYKTIASPDFADNFFSTKKNLWNETHAVKIRGYDVEMYVEDTANPVTANGVYSLLNGEWVHEPTATKPHIDDSALLAKVEYYGDEIEELLTSDASKEEIDRLLGRLKKMRQSGLADGGEFSIENLTYKGLRNLGFLDALFQARIDTEDKVLSLESGPPTQ